ncbi:MAG: LCP family protein [Eggerthellaceae bacterium]|nr:LCP family protein [Eggerthellaceae bacterium]
MAQKPTRRTVNNKAKTRSEAPSQGMNPVSPSQDYRRKNRQQPQNTSYVPASYGTASQYSRSNANYHARNTGSKVKTAIIAIILIAMIAAVAGLGYYVFKQSQKDAVNADLHKLNDQEMQALDNALTGSTKFDEPFTVLLLGSDARSDDPDMGARTDTNIIVRIDPLTNTITMMSIPRDTLIQLPGVGNAKFNAAYFYGGPSGTIEAATNLTGIPIDHYAEINFEGLVDLIDAIGGIDVYVDERIDDPDAGPYIIEEGEQHLDGELALEFSRSRAYADGDYTRQRNQRKVIDAIIHKGLEAPATELVGLIQSSTKFLTTDSAMDFDFIFSLAETIRHNNDYPVTIYSANIPSYPDMIGDVSYVIADDYGVAEMSRVFMEGGDISEVA